MPVFGEDGDLCIDQASVVNVECQGGVNEFNADSLQMLDRKILDFIMMSVVVHYIAVLSQHSRGATPR